MNGIVTRKKVKYCESKHSTETRNPMVSFIRYRIGLRLGILRELNCGRALHLVSHKLQTLRSFCKCSCHPTIRPSHLHNWTRSLSDVRPQEEEVNEYLSQWPCDFRLMINASVQAFAEGKYLDNAKERNIEKSHWLEFVNTFRRNVIKDPLQVFDGDRLKFLRLCRILRRDVDADTTSTLMHSDELRDFLFERCISAAEITLKDYIESYKVIKTCTDLSHPSKWYPFARILKRKIIFHGGPTNSGKTHHAFGRLAAADPEQGGGLYCGPLRLLALEIYDRLNREGLRASLFTGQERRDVPLATHVSCTVEMVNLGKRYDIAVIDEIQMIGDFYRGHSWTRALLGLHANEIHLAGGMEALEVVKKIIATTGDEFELRMYERLSPLKVSDISLKGDYSKIEKGDCIVAFSKADLYSIRSAVERHTKFKCAMIYGQLPPETRSSQARLFNEENTGYDVLVASDAIGMGLNLNIKRVIFHTTTKFSKSIGPHFIEPSQIKQIGGRAGRKSSNYQFGEVTTWQELDLAYVKAVMAHDVPPITAAGIFPSLEQIELFSNRLRKHIDQMEQGKQSTESDLLKDQETDDDDLAFQEANVLEKEVDLVTTPSDKKLEAGKEATFDSSSIRCGVLLHRFAQLANVESTYFLCDYAGLSTVSNWLQSIPLSLEDRFQFANAPVNLMDPLAMTILYQFAASYALRRAVALNIRLPTRKPRTVDEFEELCKKNSYLDLYLWLAHRFPGYFIQKDICTIQRDYALKMVEAALVNMNIGAGDKNHSESYQKLKSSIRRHSPELLPPASFGSAIRDSTKQLMSMVKNDELVIISVDDVSDASRFVNQPRNPNNKRWDSHSQKRPVTSHTNFRDKKTNAQSMPNVDKRDGRSSDRTSNPSYSVAGSKVSPTKKARNVKG